MTRRVTFVLLLSLFGLYVFFSCSKEDSDNESPTMKIIYPKEGDIIYSDSSYRFEAEFVDNKALSSYSIQIYSTEYNPDSDETYQFDTIMKKNEVDTVILFNKAFQNFSIFDTVRYHVNIPNAFRIDSMISANSRTYPVKTGKHYFRVTLVDIRGNVARDSFLVDVAHKIKDEASTEN